MSIPDICYHIPKSASSDDEMRRMLASGSSLDEFDINFTLMGCSGIFLKDLQNMVKRNQIEVSDYILTPYDRQSTPLIAWKVIDKNGNRITLNTLDLIDIIPFSKNGSNDYQKSDIRKWLNNELPKKLPSSFVSLVKQYSSEDRIIGDDKFWLLGLDELEKCYPKERDRIKYALVNCGWIQTGDFCYWWTRNTDDFTPSKFSNKAYIISNTGIIVDIFTTRREGCSPACIFG